MLKELVIDDIKYFMEIEDKFPNDYNKESIISEYQNNPFMKIVVYLIEGKIVGFINYYEIYDRIEIANFNVLPYFQNQGIGTKLINYVIDKYKEKCKNITLEVRKDNENAIHLYKKVGFIEKVIRKNYYNDVDGILMEKELM